MFHPYRKDSSYLRAAMFKSYKEKCVYCGRTIQQRDMHIDHIIPSNQREKIDDEVREYLIELNEKGFIVDSIENYLPSCPACNIGKTNQFFTAANLRFYHEKARGHIEEILRIIDGLKKTKETFYEPVNTEIWKELDFSYQRDLSHAIMGYRLTPADVEACPRFPQVEKIKQQLSIVDYTVLEGETGCGKSICIYQVAYDFYKNNWKVYECKAIEDIDVTGIRDNGELSLYLIDDAQQLSEKVVDELKRRAGLNVKVLLAKTISSVVKQDTILLTNKEAVALIYTDFLKKKEKISSIVHKYDKSVGINFLDQPIERRLKLANDAITPWQFNYILRGGWKNMKERYQTFCSYNNRNLLAATIAVFQILRLDHSVDFSWVCNELKKFDASLIWSKEDLYYLVNKMILLSEDDVRIVHMESAKVIIALFFKDSKENKKEILLRFIEESFIKKEISPLGLVWLCNGMSSYNLFYSASKFFITEKMIVSTLDDISCINSSQERMEIAYFIEKVFDLQYERNGRYYFYKYNELFLDWIQNSDNETAYAYSNLINTLRNVDINLHRKIARRINWTCLQESMLIETNPKLYSWGNLYNRLTCSLTKEEYLLVGKMLEDAIDKFCESASISNIEDITCFLCSVMHTNPEYIHNKVQKLIPVYSEYFIKDMSQAIYLFDFEFLEYICGFSLLGRHRTTSMEKKSAELIVSVIPEKEFSEVIVNCQPRDWHTIQSIMDLVGNYDIKKARRIINSVDLNKLTEKAKDSWCYSHEITELCDILYIGNRKLARTFIENNLDKISTMYSSLIMMAPECGIDAFDKGIKIDLLTEHWWDVSLYAIKKLYKTDVKKTKIILLENISQIIERINSVTALDFNERYFLEFMKLIQGIDGKIFEIIVYKLDYVKIENNWNRGAIYKGKGKQVEKRRAQFYKLVKR